MATTSTIAVVLHNESVIQTYCHYDGYPSHTGKILVENYNSVERAEQLIRKGSIVHLDKYIEPLTTLHNYESRERDVCLFHSPRDSEKDIDVREFSSLVAYLRDTEYKNFDYIFTENKWFVRGDEQDFIPVEYILQAVEQEDIVKTIANDLDELKNS